MCTNPMCVNFGRLYGSEDEPGDDRARYRVESSGKSFTFHCRVCDQQHELHAPASIRPLARRFLAQCLPFATCPDEICVNHDANVFENFGKVGGARKSRYRSIGGSRVRCQACGTSFALGHALNLNDNPKNRHFLQQFILAFEIHASVRQALALTAKETRVKGDESTYTRRTGKYYRSLARVSAVLRDYHAWRNAFLLSPAFRAGQTEPAKVYTDVLDVSLDRIGEGPSFKSLKVIVSVVNLREGKKKTHFLVAAHPYFLADSQLPDDIFRLIEGEKETPHILGRRWEGLESILDERPLLKDGKVVNNPPSQGYGGYILKPPYTEVAHFLTVDRMLSGFPERHYYMDGDRSQAQSALVALRRQVRDRSVQIALFQHRKRKKIRKKKEREAAADGSPDLWAPPTRKRLRKACKAVDRAFRERVACVRSSAAGEDVLPLELGMDAVWAAQVWPEGTGGAYSEDGAWAWLAFPPDRKKFRQCRTFWLTRRPGDTLADGADVLLDSMLVPVDANHGYMRRCVPTLRRPPRGATGLTDYVESSFLPDVVCDYFGIYLFLRNYKRRRAAAQKHIRADVMGLMPADRPVRTIEDAIWNFRLDPGHAREITAWLKAPSR